MFCSGEEVDIFSIRCLRLVNEVEIVKEKVAVLAETAK